MNGKTQTVERTYTAGPREAPRTVVILRGVRGTFDWTGEPLNEGDRVRLTDDGKIVRQTR